MRTIEIVGNTVLIKEEEVLGISGKQVGKYKKYSKDILDEKIGFDQFFDVPENSTDSNDMNSYEQIFNMTVKKDLQYVSHELYLNTHKHEDLLESRKKHIADFISNPEYVVNPESFKKLVSKLYFYDFLNISELHIPALENQLDKWNYGVFIEFLTQKFSNLQESVNDKHTVFATIDLISEITDILTIINRILITTTKKAEFNDNSRDFLGFISDYEEQLLVFYSENEIIKQEENNAEKFGILFLECLKTMRNFSHIIQFEWKNKSEINDLANVKIADISSATKHMLVILRWENQLVRDIVIANKDKLLSTLEQAQSEFSASIQLDKYFYYLDNSIEIDVKEQEELSEHVQVFVKSYNRDFVKTEDILINPDEVIQHFCENINDQQNLHYAIWMITKLIKFSSNQNKYELVEALFTADFESENKVDYNIELSNFRLYLQNNEEKLNKQIEKLEYYSYHDTLTGLHNRRSHDETVADEITKIERAWGNTGYLMIDIDHFKSFNDTYGHDVWDIVLQEVAKILNEATRQADGVFRLWGEEFVVLAKNMTAANEINYVCEKINQAFRDNPITHNWVVHEIKVSIWWTMILPDDKTEELSKRADEWLYAAKQGDENKENGRDTYRIT